MYSTNDKIVLFVLFVVVAHPMTCKCIDDLLKCVGLKDLIYASSKSLSTCGVVLHAFVFIMLFCLYIKNSREHFREGVDCDEEPNHLDCQ